MIKNQGGGDPSPKTPSPPPQTKVTIVGKNEIYNRENLVRPFLVHQVLGPKPPPPLPPLLKRSPAPPPLQLNPPPCPAGSSCVLLHSAAESAGVARYRIRRPIVYWATALAADCHTMPSAGSGASLLSAHDAPSLPPQVHGKCMANTPPGLGRPLPDQTPKQETVMPTLEGATPAEMNYISSVQVLCLGGRGREGRQRGLALICAAPGIRRACTGRAEPSPPLCSSGPCFKGHSSRGAGPLPPGPPPNCPSALNRLKAWVLGTCFSGWKKFFSAPLAHINERLVIVPCVLYAQLFGRLL